MNFNNKIPDWKNTGTEPSTSLKNGGFQAGQKPPAAIFNWFWSLVSKSITELQMYVGRREVAGNTVKPTLDTSVTSEIGAEIANDYRTRAYDGNGVATTGNVASGKYSKAEGCTTTASGNYSHAEGILTQSSGYASHAEGYQTEATASFTHAEGHNTKATEAHSHAEGNGTSATGTAAHSEGAETIASGSFAHAEGNGGKATARCTHAEGYMTQATIDYAHAEGNECIASGVASHSEGSKTEATAYYAHAEGGCTTAIGNYAHIEGYSVKKAKEVIPDLSSETTNDAIINAWNNDKFSLAKGGHSHCEGGNCLALDSYSHAEGKETIAKGKNSHAEGSQTIASGENSHSEGNQTTASGGSSHAEGNNTTASGGNAHSEGWGTKASGYASHAEGENTTASGKYSHAEGNGTTASGDYSHAEGGSTTANGLHSHAQNQDCHANGDLSDAGGLDVTVNAYGGFGRGMSNTVEGMYTNALGMGLSASGEAQTVCGKYNDTNSDAYLMVGCGSDEDTKANALRVSREGKCYGSSAFLASGADYAEMFEWQDGNPDNEDRRGLFVTLDGEKIRLANSNDDILGVVSATPSVVGDTRSEEWHGKFKKDIFGADIWETVEVEEKVLPNGDVIPAHTEKRRVLNPDYDPTKDYISRDERKEWAAIGIVGKLIMIDDGTCEVNGFCTVGENGVATKAESKTAYRVMSRIDDTHIRVFIK